MKQRVDELERLLDVVSTAVKARSTALADTQRLVGKFESQVRAAAKSLNEVRAHDLLAQRHELAVPLRTDEQRRLIEVSLSQLTCYRPRGGETMYPTPANGSSTGGGFTYISVGRRWL